MRSLTAQIVLLLLIATLTPHALAASKSKPVVAVSPVELSTQNISCRNWRANCTQGLQNGFRAMLETAIVKTRKMNVVERVQSGSVINEQGLGQVGITTSGGKVGGLTGADYSVYGTITKFGSQKSGFNLSSGSGLSSLLPGQAQRAVGNVSMAGVTTEMAVDIKITDVATGNIVVADSVSASVKHGSSFSIGGIQQAQASADPFADVQRVVAARIAEVLVTSRIPVKVIAVQSNGTLILNYGNVFFKPGDQLAAFSIGESFKDPDTGEVLGSEETQLGVVQIIASESKFSRAKIAGEPFNIQKGTILKRIKSADSGNPERQRTGSTW